MIRSFLVVAVLASLAFGQTENWNGYLDTTACRACSSTVTWWSKAFKLANYANLRVSVRAQDTSAAGYAADAVNGTWGYQTFHTGQTTGTTVDSIFDVPVVVDSFKMTTSTNLRNFSTGTAVLGSYDSTGYLTRQWGMIDTTGFALWATQTRPISPDWDVFIRFFWIGKAGNRVAGKIKGPLFQMVRSIGEPVQVK